LKIGVKVIEIGSHRLGLLASSGKRLAVRRKEKREGLNKAIAEKLRAGSCLFFVALAFFAAIFHGFPVVAPLFAVFKGQPASSTNFSGKLTFFESGSHRRERKEANCRTFAARLGAVYV
jgi:hypothetical protein